MRSTVKRNLVNWTYSQKSPSITTFPTQTAPCSTSFTSTSDGEGMLCNWLADHKLVQFPASSGCLKLHKKTHMIVTKEDQTRNFSNPGEWWQMHTLMEYPHKHRYKINNTRAIFSCKVRSPYFSETASLRAFGWSLGSFLAFHTKQMSALGLLPQMDFLRT